MTKVFIDGSAGTTGLRIFERLSQRSDLELVTLTGDLRKDPEAIRKELEYRICPETLGGGTIFALDHRIPNGVSIENYRYYVQLGRELLGLPAATESPFRRMAF